MIRNKGKFKSYDDDDDDALLAGVDDTNNDTNKNEETELNKDEDYGSIGDSESDIMRRTKIPSTQKN